MKSFRISENIIYKNTCHRNWTSNGASLKGDISSFLLFSNVVMRKEKPFYYIIPCETTHLSIEINCFSAAFFHFIRPIAILHAKSVPKTFGDRWNIQNLLYKSRVCLRTRETRFDWTIAREIYSYWRNSMKMHKYLNKVDSFKSAIVIILEWIHVRKCFLLIPLHNFPYFFWFLSSQYFDVFENAVSNIDRAIFTFAIYVVEKCKQSLVIEKWI